MLAVPTMPSSRRLHLVLCYLEAEFVGEATDHRDGRGAELLEVDVNLRSICQRQVARGDEMCR